MHGILENGLAYAQEGEVRVIVYPGCDAGAVQVKTRRDMEWRIARAGEVSYGVIIELTRQAKRALPGAPYTMP